MTRHFRLRGYLAVDEEGVVTALPIQYVSEQADRERFAKDLAEWQAEHPGVLASVEGP